MTEMTFACPAHIGCARGHECWLERQRKAMREMAKARIASGWARTYSKNDYAEGCRVSEGGCGRTMRWTRDADGNDSPLEENAVESRDA